MPAGARVGRVVAALRLAASDVATLNTHPQVEGAAALFALLSARFDDVVGNVSALSAGSGEGLHVVVARPPLGQYRSEPRNMTVSELTIASCMLATLLRPAHGAKRRRRGGFVVPAVRPE